MNYVYMIFFPLLSIIVLFLLTKLIGYRQMSQLSLFDYINGITIGSIAAEAATSEFNQVVEPLVALIIFGLVTYLTAIWGDKRIKARRAVNGKPIPLIVHGKFYDKNFSKAHLDLTEFTMQARNQGYFDVSRIDTAYLEPNGIMSILPKSQARPVTPEDMNFVIPQEMVYANVIMDGEVMNENLKNIGLDEKWITGKIKELGCELQEVFLVTASESGDYKIYLREGVWSRDVLA